jgi:uncharacterized protein YwgA
MEEISDMASMDVADLDPKELILTLLHYSDGSIPGALYLQKLVFLAVNEDKETRIALEKKTNFRPLNFGPYSDPVRKAVAELESKGLVISKNQLANKYNREVFMLTEAGRRMSSEQVRKLSQGAREYLRNLCLAARQLGYSGILRYVYSKYPESASKSRIKEEVFRSYDY